MASSRKFLDTDIITLRKIYIRDQYNSTIAASSVLISDGAGGTYWSPLTSIGLTPTFNQLNLGFNTYTATNVSTSVTILPGPGIAFQDAGPGLRTNYLFSRAFQTIAVNGQESLSAYSNATLTPTINFSTSGSVQITTDTRTNTLFFNTGNQFINVISNASTVTLVPRAPYQTFTSQNVSTLQFAGVGDVFLTTNTTTNTVNFNLRGYSQTSYTALSGEVFSLGSTIIGQISTTYLQKRDLSTAISVYSTTIAQAYAMSNISSATSTITYSVWLATQSTFSTNAYSTLTMISTQNYITLSTINGTNFEGISSISSLLSIALVSISTTTYAQLSNLSTTLPQNISTISSYYYGLNQSTLSTFMYGTLASTTAGYSSFYSTLTNQSFSTIYSFSTPIVSSQLISTTSSLLSQVSTFYTYMSSLSTTLTSTFVGTLRIPQNIISSIGYTGTYGYSQSFYAEPATSNVTISTAFFSMSGIVSSFSSNASILLEFNPNLLFPAGKSISTPNQTISTYIVYGNQGTPLLDTTFSDNFQMNQYDSNVPLSNPYSRLIKLRLDPTFVRQNGISNYFVVHRSPGLFSSINASQQTLHVLPSQRNSLYLNIFNTR